MKPPSHSRFLSASLSVLLSHFCGLALIPLSVENPQSFSLNLAFLSVLLLPLSQQRSAIPKPNAMAHCPDGISGPNISTTTATIAAPPTSQQSSLIPSPPPAPPASSSPTHNPPPSTTTAVQHAASVMDVDCKSPENRSQRAASVLSMDDLEAAQALEGLRSGLYTHSCLLYI